MAKKKTLPKDFESLLENSTITELIAIFDVCELDARGGYGKHTALAFDKCPDDLARWLVSQGADLSATDTWGNTPLHCRARSWRSNIGVLLELGADVNCRGSSKDTPLHAASSAHIAVHADLLIRHGADVNERNRDQLTPLDLALQSCSNIDIENMVSLAKVLLDGGAERTEQTSGFVKEIGCRFEFHRSAFAPERVEAVSVALDDLYGLFQVQPIPPRQIHDGTSPITVTTDTWQKQHDELWNLLVPSKGAAATIQGEVIRISGRVADEIERNGGANWDREYEKMANAYLEHVQGGKPLSSSDVSEAAVLVAKLKHESCNTARLAELAVKWVIQNPTPVRLDPPKYRR